MKFTIISYVQKRIKKELVDKSFYKIAASIILILVLAWCLRLPEFYVRMFIQNNHGTKGVLEDLPGLKKTNEEELQYDKSERRLENWREQQLKDYLSLTASDGTSLSGILYDSGFDKTAILLHGFSGDADTGLLIAPYYAGSGFNIFMPDSRLHGNSGGTAVSWGQAESADLLEWISLLTDRFGEGHSFVIHGESLGASTILLAAKDLPANVRFIVADMPFINLYSTGYDLLSRQFHLPAFIFMPVAEIYARTRTGFSIHSLDLTEAAGAGEIPLILISGSKNKLTDPDDAYTLKKLWAGTAALINIEGAISGMNYVLGEKQIEEALDYFIAAYL